MPKLIRLYITSCAIGFGVALAFAVGLVALDVANLRHLILGTDIGWLAFIMLWLSNGVVFAGVQFGIAVMGLTSPTDGPKGGRSAPVVTGELARVALPAGKRR